MSRADVIEEVIETERIERIKYIIELFDLGLNDEDCIGYLGTSLEFINLLIKEGVLLGITYEPEIETGVEEGDLFFYPRKSKFSNHPLKDTFLEELEVIEEAALDAELIARTHYFLKTLQLYPDDAHQIYCAQELTGEWHDGLNLLYQNYLDSGFSRETLDKAINVPESRKGIVLGLKSEILNFYEILEGETGKGDLKIHVPDGLDYRFLSGIEPVGKKEFDFFLKLQEEYG